MAELDACLAICVDMSGSFSDSWDRRAYQMFLELSDRFFTGSVGGNNRIVIAQLSGSEQVVLFEGQPSDLRSRLKTPEELNQFLKEQSDPSKSPVYSATKRMADYVNAIPTLTERTRLLTVILSDMQDSESDRQARSVTGHQMLESLKTYQQRGGSIALYFVAETETARWARILSMAGFQPGHDVIENQVTSSPRLPTFN
ncbi:MAG: hypothetical protein ABI619_09355 [Betaproteobacteria bacterium]